MATLAGEPVTFTARVTPAGLGTASGVVTFFDGESALVAPQALNDNQASLTVSALTSGIHDIRAVYGGDGNFDPSTASAVSQAIGDFNFTITPAPGDPTGSTDQTVLPGQAATYAFNVQPIAGPFNFPVTLSARGLPPGATVSFSPQTVTVGAAAAPFNMTIQTARISVAFEGVKRTSAIGGTLALALLLFPFSASLRQKTRAARPLALLACCVGSAVLLAGLTACGTSNGYFGQPQTTYTVELIGTAQGTQGATLQHVATVRLTVQ